MKKTNQASLKSNYLYTLSYQILLIIAPLITAPYISRVLGAENIGIYSYTSANVTYFILFGVLGLSTYSQREVAKRRDNEKKLSQFFVESVVVRLMTMGMSIVVYMIFIHMQSEYKVMYEIHMTLLIAQLVDITWLLQGLEKFKAIAIRNLIIKILTVIMMFVFVKSADDLYVYTWINGLGTLLGNMSVIPYAKKNICLKNCERLHLVKHLKTTMIFFLPSIASVLITTVDKMMIGYYTVAKLQNGYYEQATKIELLIFSVFSSLNIIMRPRMAYLSAGGKNEEIQEKMWLSVQYVITLALPMSFGLFCVADHFVPWFFGEEYFPVIGLLKIFAWWLSFKAVSNCILEQYIIPMGGEVTATKIFWIGAVVNVILNAWLIPGRGAAGAAVASVVSEFVILAMTYWKSSHVIPLKKIIKVSWKKFLAVLIMMAILLYTNFLFSATVISCVIQIIFGVAIYLTSLLVLRDQFLTEILRNSVKIMRKRIQDKR